ncbi:MAG TPA: YCF48-related protein [Tenuifilaceae bacterium]|nr:YCF48-related protein [Tenuifilaceae bacterium]
MKKSTLILLLTVLSISLTAQTWESVIEENADYHYNAVQFLNEDEGYVIGSGPAASTPVVLKTTDGGENWTDVANDLPEGYVNTLAFSDVNSGFITLSSGKIFLTTDGGENWTQMLTDEDGNVFTVKYAGNYNDADVFYAFTASKIYKTVEMGENWELAYNHGSNVFVTAVLTNGNGISFGSENKALFAYGSDNGELYMYDGEEAYSVYESTHANPFSCVFAVSDDVYFASSGTRFVRVTDPGEDNQITNNLTNALYINALNFLDINHGFGATSTGDIYFLKNLGSSYTKEYDGDIQLNGVSIASNSSVFACGKGIILKRSGNIVDDNTSVFGMETGKNIFRIYPNPSNGEINIELTESMQNALYEVYDISGRKIIASQPINSTCSKINLDSGVYLIVVSDGKFSQVEKAIIF